MRKQCLTDRLLTAPLGEHQREWTYQLAPAIHPCDQAMNIGISHEGFAILHGPIKRFGVILREVEHLDAINLVCLQQLLMHRIERRFVIRPSRVIPHDKCALPFRLVDCLQWILHIHRVAILQKERIQMAQRFGASNLRTVNHHESQLIAPLLSNLERLVQISFQQLFMRAILNVISDRNRIQPLLPSLFHPHIRPHRAIGESRMDMEITL